MSQPQRFKTRYVLPK